MYISNSLVEDFYREGDSITVADFYWWVDLTAYYISLAMSFWGKGLDGIQENLVITRNVRTTNDGKASSR